MGDKEKEIAKMMDENYRCVRVVNDEQMKEEINHI